MTDAPERIWAYTGAVMGGVPSWEWGLAFQSDDEVDDLPEPVEYLRADAVEARLAAAERLVEAVTHEREMVCQDFDLQRQASEAVDAALTEWGAAKGERG